MTKDRLSLQDDLALFVLGVVGEGTSIDAALKSKTDLFPLCSDDWEEMLLSTVLFANDDVLDGIDETTGQVPRLGGLERRVDFPFRPP